MPLILPSNFQIWVVRCPAGPFETDFLAHVCGWWWGGFGDFGSENWEMVIENCNWELENGHWKLALETGK